MEIVGPKSPERIMNLEDLLSVMKIDINLWEVISQEVNKRDSQMKTNDGDVRITELFQVKAKLKPLTELARPDIQKVLRQVFAEHIPKLSGPSAKDGPLLANINLADLHIGRVEEKNLKAYIKNIKDRTLRIFETLLKDKPDAFLFGSLGDMANSEMNGYTSSGKNAQHNGISGKDLFKEVLAFHLDLTKQFSSEIATELVIIPGNHDRQLMATIGDTLQLYFSNTNNVKIDNEDKPRKYKKWWDTTLAFSHGDWEKPKDRLSVLSQEQGVNKYNYWNIGHFHEREVKQYGPLEVETLASPAVQSEREKNQFAHKNAKLYWKIYSKKNWKIKEIGQ